jgi:hypothetical protein
LELSLYDSCSLSPLLQNKLSSPASQKENFFSLPLPFWTPSALSFHTLLLSSPSRRPPKFFSKLPERFPSFYRFLLENPLLAYFSFFLPPPPPLSRYQIIVLQPPQSSKRTLTLSRLIGFPKDRLEIQENKQNHSQEKVLVLVLENGKETLVLGNPIAFSSLPLGTLSNYLVLNDNSLSPEQDSRHFGLISFQQIRGQVLMIGSFLRPLPSPKERTKNF